MVMIDAIEVRNELSHDYDGEKFEKAEVSIRETIYPALIKLHDFFLGQLTKDQLGQYNG